MDNNNCNKSDPKASEHIETAEKMANEIFTKFMLLEQNEMVARIKECVISDRQMKTENAFSKAKELEDSLNKLQA